MIFITTEIKFIFMVLPFMPFMLHINRQTLKQSCETKSRNRFVSTRVDDIDSFVVDCYQNTVGCAPVYYPSFLLVNVAGQAHYFIFCFKLVLGRR